MGSNIGLYTARSTWTGHVITGSKWHKVESEVSIRSVTHCGRQMRNENREGYLVFESRENLIDGAVCNNCK